MSQKSRFKHVAIAGITFQAGSSAIDSSTIMSALVFQLTGNPILVGAVTAILRFGWLFPQLIVGYLAQHGGSSMRYYVIGAFGRALAMGLMALVLALGSGWNMGVLAGFVMVIWTVYAFVSGIVGVPYNDIVARSVAPNLRSRLLATRFFGGGLLALVVVGFADRLVTTLAFPLSYAAIVAMAAGLMLASSVVFTVMGEPVSAGEKIAAKSQKPTFFQYLKEGVGVFRNDLTFRKFVYAQWCGGAVLMAMPFYVVQAAHSGVDLVDIAWLMGAQTTGALLSNVLWGWWGDRLGKVSLLRGIALGRIVPPAIALASGLGLFAGGGEMFYVYLAVFFVLGALANGLTIAVIGFLMEISPDDRRPAYSGYFNAITAPAFLLPLLAGLLAALVGLGVVFLLAMIAAVMQVYFLLRIDVSGASA